MSLLQQVQRGRSHLPPRILVYGTEGVGKSSLAATTPKPIFIQTEDGLGEIDCDKFPLAKSLEDVVAALTELETQQHDYPSRQTRHPVRIRHRRNLLGGSRCVLLFDRATTGIGPRP
jgi:hypothetical protein